eukprot:augustus_masked-scaffold_3-processed-gene-9.66-mRNA-1 protein AED:1.00 eAED:1.00 QI:0/-1/0/0/-1/1/1/0/439
MKSEIGKKIESVIKQNKNVMMPLGIFLGSFGDSLEVLLEKEKEIQELVPSLLFGSNKGLTVESTNKQPVVDLEEDVNYVKFIEEPFSYESFGVGGFSLKVAFPRKKIEEVETKNEKDDKLLKNTLINYLIGKAHGAGFVRLDNFFSFGSDIIQHVFDAGVDGAQLKEGTEEILPEFFRFLYKFTEKETLEFNISPKENSLLTRITGDFNMKKFRKEYPSIARILGYVAEFETRLCKPTADKGKYHTGEYLYKIKLIHNSSSTAEFELMHATPYGGRGLVWMKDDTSTDEKVVFDWDQDNKLVVDLSIKLRLGELGCTKIHLPRSFTEMNITKDRETGIPKVDVSVIHIEPESTMQRILVAPVMSFPVMRKLLEQLFFIGISTDKNGLNVDYKIPFLPPPRILSVFLKILVSRYLKHQSWLLFFKDMFSALGEDVKNACT